MYIKFRSTLKFCVLFALQVEAAMAFNRRMDQPLALHCTSWGGEVAQFGNYIGKAWLLFTFYTTSDVFKMHSFSALVQRILCLG